MRLIASSTVRAFVDAHPETRAALERWVAFVKQSDWAAPADVQAAFSKAKMLNGERARFETAGGDFRLIAAVDFGRGIAFVKFIGTHAEYDRGRCPDRGAFLRGTST